jgi:hypothetical protein
VLNTPQAPIAARLDSKSEFGKLQGTRYYEDAVYKKFSDDKMKRWYTAVQDTSNNNLGLFLGCTYRITVSEYDLSYLCFGICITRCKRQ